MRFGGAFASDKKGSPRPRPEGQWTIEAARNDATAGDLPVSCTAFSDDRALDYDVSLPPCVVASRDAVTFELQVTDRGEPAGAVREARVTLLSPVESPENVLNRFQGRVEPKGSSADVSGIGRAVETLRADPKAFAALRRRSSSTITLRRNPKKEGSFLASLPACTVAGSYHLEIGFRVAIGPAAIETTRTVRRTLRVIPDVRVITPQFHAEYDEFEKVGYIMAMLKDKWGNIFGPGLGELITCEPSWGAKVVTHDFLNCTYGIAVTGTSAKQWTSGKVQIEFGRQKIYSGIAGKMPKVPRRSRDLMKPFMERIEKSKS
jgi:hypothetical protein